MNIAVSVLKNGVSALKNKGHKRFQRKDAEARRTQRKSLFYNCVVVNFIFFNEIYF